LTGKSLISSEGETWHKQRKLMAPAFHRSKLALLANDMTQEITKFGNKWDEAMADKAGVEIEIVQEMMRLTMQIASKSLFSSDIIAKADEVGNALKEVLHYVAVGFKNPFHPSHHFPTAGRRRFNAAKTRIENTLLEIIHERKREQQQHHDMLGLLLDLQDEETGTGMSDRQLLDEVIALIIGGHETTSLSMTWVWYFLAQNPEKEAKLFAEVESVLNGRTPTFEDFPKLPYTSAVFQEAMRLYPPAWAIVRETVEDDVVLGYKIPAGSEVFLPLWASYHDAEHWEQPETFQPERFLPENKDKLSKYQFLPFSAGMKKCIGDNFAMLEGVLITAMFVQKYQFELLDNAPLTFDTGFTLKPRNGIKMRVKMRL
jgi:cytochrome P450